MGLWVNRTVLSGASVDPNGTTSHTCTFTPATSGNFLVAIVAGAVTSTTPSGWSLSDFMVGNAGIYAFYKTATSGESSFSTTHNGSNYAIQGVVYEFQAGTAYLGGESAAGSSGTLNGPTPIGLSGTYSRFAARSWGQSTSGAVTSCVWTLPTIEDYDVTVPAASQDGIYLTIAYDDGATGSSFTANSTITTNQGGSGEAVAFALTVVDPPPAVTPINWITGIPSP